MSDQSKSRRQVLRQLVQLGVIGSAKELKKNRSTSLHTCHQNTRLMTSFLWLLWWQQNCAVCKYLL